ncbi:MAG: hypothetical protein QOK20_1449, partial [Acidimicrobiaceae bacterium]|nr:hypothetical protein [Acidimicrobiaceae bacterium]
MDWGKVPAGHFVALRGGSTAARAGRAPAAARCSRGNPAQARLGDHHFLVGLQWAPCRTAPGGHPPVGALAGIARPRWRRRRHLVGTGRARSHLRDALPDRRGVLRPPAPGPGGGDHAAPAPVPASHGRSGGRRSVSRCLQRLARGGWQPAERGGRPGLSGEVTAGPRRGRVLRRAARTSATRAAGSAGWAVQPAGRRQGTGEFFTGTRSRRYWRCV